MARAIPFKQADVSRAIKGAIVGGMNIGRVEIDPSSGKIVILPPDAKAQEENPLDKWLRKHAG
jgi:hypothetical protein